MAPSPVVRRRPARAVRSAIFRALRSTFCVALCLAALSHLSPAQAQRARITNLSDVDFGLISNLQVESRRSQSICVYSNSGGGGYSVVASGSGPGASFALANGASALAYAVEWSQLSAQTSGVQLSPNVALAGQTSAAGNQFCSSGPATSASLTVVLRAADLSQAREGTYGGSLTLLIAPE